MKRYRSTLKGKSMTSAPARVQRLALFGPPLLLEGEDAAVYDELLARMCAAIKPVDIIDEMLLADLIFLEWDVLRFRRLKWSLLRASGQKALEDCLKPMLDCDMSAFEEKLARALEQKIAEDEAHELAYRCARSEPDADKKVDELLASVGLDQDDIVDFVRSKKAKELAQEYARREPDTIKLVDELLTSSGLTMHDIMARVLAEKIDQIERIDRLITLAETRRNASLREIDRRRAALGAALRRTVQEAEDAEFEVIETTGRQERARRDQ